MSSTSTCCCRRSRRTCASASRAHSYRVEFAGEELFFPRSDTLLLPVRNSTVEEYARYLLERLLEDSALIGGRDIREVGIKVSSGPGQWGSSHWRGTER